MIILTIETSCDETSICVVDGKKIISHYTFSQVEGHKKYGGVVPEIASRLHSEKIAGIIKKLNIKKIDLIGFTRGPGLKGSLLVGKIAALTLSNYFQAPLYGINHLEGHLLSVEIEDDEIKNKLKFPLVALIVSGGHTELWYVEDYGKYKLIGRTLDDACGEAFDKVAKVCGMGYPGGPVIEKFALKNKDFISLFTVPEVKNSLNYSFSGIKTQVAYYVKKLKKLDYKEKIKISYSFQDAVSKSLLNKLKIAVERYQVKNIVVCGGVSANNYLRSLIANTFNGFNLFFPQRKYTSDNAAMIAVVMLRMIEKGLNYNNIEIDPDLQIS